LLEGGVGFVEGVFGAGGLFAEELGAGGLFTEELVAGGLFAEELATGEGLFPDLPDDWFGEGFDVGEGFCVDVPEDWFWEGFDERFWVLVCCELARVEDAVEAEEAWRLRP
jgi:hypothetical protein